MGQVHAGVEKQEAAPDDHLSRGKCWYLPRRRNENVGWRQCGLVDGVASGTVTMFGADWRIFISSTSAAGR